MALNRRLAPLPKVFDLEQVSALTQSRYASALAVNVVDNGDGTASLAAYWDGWAPAQTSLDAWRADVAAATVEHPTADEQVAAAANNEASIRQKLVAALAANDAAVNDALAFIATAKPATAAAQASAAYDQAKTLTQGSIGIRRQLSGLIRLVLGALDTTAGT